MKREIFNGAEVRRLYLSWNESRASVTFGRGRKKSKGRLGVERHIDLTQLRVRLEITIHACKRHCLLRIGQLDPHQTESMVQHLLRHNLRRWSGTLLLLRGRGRRILSAQFRFQRRGQHGHEPGESPPIEGVRHWVNSNQTCSALARLVVKRSTPVRRWLSMVLYWSVVSMAGETGATAALEKLRGLAGDWEGTVEWTGARTSHGAMNAKYYTTGNGSAVVEDLITDGTPVMTSVYHLDGPDLRMTHYCGAQNQPRLKANRIALDEGALDFGFVDITNLKSPDAPHVVGTEMRLLAPDHITVTFLFDAAGKQSRERIDLKWAGEAK